MKNRLKIILFFIIIIIINFCIYNKSMAQAELYVTSDLEYIQKGQEFRVKVNLENNSIAACTINVYFDNSKLEYVKKDENSNLLENEVRYTWVDETGGLRTKSGEIVDLTFKAKETGNVMIGVDGEFYDSDGNEIKTNLSGTKIIVEEENVNNDENNEEVSSDNTKLAIMRLNREGISPEFNEDIKEYYLIVTDEIDNLDITAVPKNSGATVKISGNNNLKYGKNQIVIEVTSQDNTKKDNYIINVTKTSDVKKANANLENLAIENAILTPEFDPNVTQYETEVSYESQNLNILAVPQNMKAMVKIDGKDDLKIGDNIVNIITTAEDDITQKKYVIKVHRRNEEEEMKNEENQEYQAKLLNNLLEEKKNEEINSENLQNEDTEENLQTKNNINLIWIIVIIFIVVAILVAVIIYIRVTIHN